ncbi:MAG: ribonuclease III [Clostridia bacterium]|nr:ribonuclease III [Clostridia bacterium]
MCPDAVLLSAPLQTAIPPREMSGLQLAFIGDCVFELLVRGSVLETDTGNVRQLHRHAVAYANAAFQARAAVMLEPFFNEEELAVYRRGRNAHTTHTPKNKSEAQYHRATGLEAVFGYLYLCGAKERLQTLFRLIQETVKEEEKHEKK